MKRLFITGTFNFPYGTAPGSRILNIAEGFAFNGYHIDIVALSPPPGEIRTDYDSWKFICENIRYRYLNQKQEKNKNQYEKLKWFIKNWSVGYQIKNIYQAQSKLHDYSGVFLYGRNYSILNPILSLVSKNKIKIITDIVELPKVLTNKIYLLNPTHLDQYFGYRSLIKKSTILTVITTYLMQKINKSSLTYLLPSVQKWNFSEQDSEYYDRNNCEITYVGSLIERDNPEALLSFIEEMIMKEPKFKLNLVGRYNSNKSGVQFINNIKSNSELSKHINLIGEVTEKEKQEIYYRSFAFILPRRDHIEEIASFPTRIIEYIAQKKLVIASPVGDISYYFNENEIVYLTDSDISKCVNEVNFLYKNKEAYNSIVENAIQKGSTVFNNQIHTKNLDTLLFKTKIVY